jgi:hypothetical protein
MADRAGDELVRTRVHPAVLLRFLLFVGGYAALIAWFKYVDVYHTHFSGTGVVLSLHNLFRLLFVFYLFWTVQAVGAVFLRLFGANPTPIGTLDYLALTFFAGAGPWQVLLLIVGYLNLLNTTVMVILTAPVVVLSFREFHLTVPRLRVQLVDGFNEARMPVKAAYILLVLVWCAVFLIKGLYPGGSQDYYSQYFPAYQAFVDHGSIWPNEAWWQYLYAKGAGFIFLGILLTDALAPQLVTFCFLSASGVATFLFARRFASGTAWPVIGALLFFALYVYTPGWGEFGKLHEFNTAFVIAILWMTVVALDDATPNPTVWLAAAASALAAAIITAPSAIIGVFLAAVFAALTVTYVFMGDSRRGFVCLAFAALAAVVVAIILLINFITIGLLSDFALHYLWGFADFAKLQRSGALPMVLSMYRTSIAGVPLEKSFNFLNFTMRLYLLWPLFFGGLLVAATSAYDRYLSENFGKRRISDETLVLLAAILVFVALTVTVGRGLSGSFYRFANFIVPVVIVAGCAMWTAPIRHRSTPSFGDVLRRPLIPIAVLGLCAVVIAVKTRIDRNIVPLGVNALKHAAGIISIDDAYARQFSGHSATPRRNAIDAVGIPALAVSRQFLAGVYPGARGAYSTVGPHTPIWSMHVDSYCMLPDCKMRSFLYFVMTPSWDRLMWGTPEEGRAALQAAGLNYFLYSRELQINDPLPLSPLFSPDNISHYFGIGWTDGTTTLLIWLGPDTAVLDDAWVSEYRQAVAASTFVRHFPDAAMKAIFERLRDPARASGSVESPWEGR